MRLGLVFAVAVISSAAMAIACVTQEDPPYGPPGAIAKWNFPGESSTSGGATTGDGGSSGTPAGPFAAVYNPTMPPPPDQPTGTLHPTVSAGVAITRTTQCLSCHGAGQTGATKKWAAAGWAAAAPAADAGLDKGEVVIYDGTKTLGPVKTAPDGYFWVPATLGTVGAQSGTAIRDSNGKVSPMTQKLGGNGDCNNTTCHGGGAGPIDFKP